MDFPAGPLKIRSLGWRPGAAQPPSDLPPFRWVVPGSKSITNRALVLAALAEGETTLRGVLHSDDTRHMRAALQAMGIEIEDVDATTLVVRGGRSRLRAPAEPVFVGNSGTTVRFLTALAALIPGTTTLVGDEHMGKRPISDLVDGLRKLGVQVECETGCPPLTIHGGSLPGGRTSMPGEKSSQYFSALLLVAPYADGPLEIGIEGKLVSRPYVEITTRMMGDFGAAEVTGNEAEFRIEPGCYQPHDYAIEPDASSASYAFAAAAITGLGVVVPALGKSALQGDYAFLDILEEVGAKVERRDEETVVRGTGALRGVDVDMHHISDTVMTLAAIAPLASGSTKIRNIANIRIKETDRLAATVSELSRLGQGVDSGEDWLSVEPAAVEPALVHSYADHRMAMSFAVLGLGVEGVAIEDPACVKKTYPGFWESLTAFEKYARAASAG